jgi:AraC-like DNA-binding protein/mannose-6-phosphate isomerase-like protein (cupin superfamily)
VTSQNGQIRPTEPRRHPSNSPQRFFDLDRNCVSLRVGLYRIDALYWGYLGSKWWRNYLHTHSFFEVCYAVGGTGTFRTMEKDLPIKSGELFIAKPGDTHEIISARRAPLQIFFWAFTLVPASGGAIRDAEQSANRLLDAFILSSRRTGPMSASIKPTLGMLTEEVSRTAAGCTMAVDALALKLLLDTARCLTEGAVPVEVIDPVPHSERDAIAKTALRYLRDNLSRQIEVRDVAAQVHLSERHLSRLFREITGVTVLEYLTNLRIEMASQLLLDKEIPIKQIARSVGYPDSHYFTTLFGKRTGMTPNVFRSSGGTKFLKPKK